MLGFRREDKAARKRRTDRTTTYDGSQQDFFEDYEEVLNNAGLLITLIKVYVDEGRQVTSMLEKRMRYDPERKKFTWSREAEEEDEALEEGGEDCDSFMARLYLLLMNSINQDLKFTVEVAGNFPTKSLPPFDFIMEM